MTTRTQTFFLCALLAMIIVTISNGSAGMPNNIEVNYQEYIRMSNIWFRIAKSLFVFGLNSWVYDSLFNTTK